MTTPKPPTPKRICQGSGGHKAKVSKTTGRILSHHYRGEALPWIRTGPGTEEDQTMTAFRQYDDIAAIECDEAGKPAEGGEVRYGTVTETGPWSVTARIDARTFCFLIDSRGRAWRDSGRLRLVPLCRCERPVLTGDDPFCSDECRDDAAQAYHEQHYTAR